MKAWEKRIAEADWIYEVCKGCGGFLFGAADIPGCKRDIQAAMYRATKAGNAIVIVRPEQDRESRPIGCKCERGTTGGEG